MAEPDGEEKGPVPRLSWRRWHWALLLFRPRRREAKGDVQGALDAIAAAERIKPLWAEERVQRAMLLLKAERHREAQQAFAALWKEWEGADDPNLRYLRHFCNAMLGMIRVDAGPMGYAARATRNIPCRPSLRWRFPLAGGEED